VEYVHTNKRKRKKKKNHDSLVSLAFQNLDNLAYGSSMPPFYLQVYEIYSKRDSGTRSVSFKSQEE
jgi:hypothetical protein